MLRYQHKRMGFVHIIKQKYLSYCSRLQRFDYLEKSKTIQAPCKRYFNEILNRFNLKSQSPALYIGETNDDTLSYYLKIFCNLPPYVYLIYIYIYLIK